MVRTILFDEVKNMYYRENKELSADTKQAYIDGLNSILAQRQALSRQQRDSYCKDFFSRQEEHRTALRQTLGWPLTEEKPLSPPAATAEFLGPEQSSVSRCRNPVGRLDCV